MDKIMVILFGGVFVENVFSPKGSQKQKKLPQHSEISKCLDLLDCTMVLLISTYKFDAQNIPDALKHVPDFFEGPLGREIGFRYPGPENRISLLGAKRPRGGMYTNCCILQQFAYTPPNRPHQSFPYFF